ncbi:MAG TPA: Nramp family divalent metal transporter [Longimicrobiales bacterium]|nr:Nramp family divalent metal transporter [Longimicrobiales bacterium]
MKSSRRSPVGPGWIVAAAFIGPGTVTTATVAGASFGTALLWALAFSTVATMILQEMAARLGLVTGQGLGEAIRGRFHAGPIRTAAAAFVVLAIAGGNAAYQTGNLLGGSLGLEGIVGGDVRLWVAVLGGLAALLLWSGSYRLVERFMVAMVGLMSLVFLATAVTLLPSAGAWLPDLFIPSLPTGSLLLAVGLVGTTVVPYNLFLHASAVSERYDGEVDLPSARLELVLSIGLGGVVSLAILLTAAGTLSQGGGVVESAADMARSLEPILGSWASAFFAAGLFAAGMTSAVTAPLAAAWATAGVLGWRRDLKDPRVRGVWGGVLGIGVLLGVLGVRPVPAILFAQAANGILLPAVAVFLLMAVNDGALMKGRANRWPSNLLGGLVVLVAAVLGGRALLSVAGLI